MNRFGFVERIIIDELTKEIIAGEGRVKTLLQKKDSGENPPDGIKKTDKDWEVPVLRGLSFDEKERELYAIASNRISERGGWNKVRLSALLVEDLDGLRGIGFDKQDIETINKSLDLECRPINKEHKSCICPECGFEFSR